MFTTKTALALAAALAVPGVVLAVAAEHSEPAMYHLAEDTDAIWSYAEPGAGRLPSIDIADDIYPDARGVQFLVDGEPDDRNPSARPDGYDATGPQDDSTFHIYPKIDLSEGTKLEARWWDGDGTAHRTAWIVGESRFMYGLVGEDQASWTHVGSRGRVQPTITIDDSIYPNARGVQFIIDGQVYDRSKARPDGFDATGPQDGSEFHAYPKLRLEVGTQIEARWIDRSRVGRSSVMYVGSGVVEPPSPTPTTVATPTTAPATPTTPPTIVVTLPPTTMPSPVTTPPTVVTTTQPPTTQPPATTVAPTTTVAPPSGGTAETNAAWVDVESGSNRQPTIVIDNSVYPNGSGVQFLLNGKVDERCSCRPDGYDATGPQEASKYHIYPAISLSGGDVIEARWTDSRGQARSAKAVVAGTPAPSDPPVTDVPPPAPDPFVTTDDAPASWQAAVDSGSISQIRAWYMAHTGHDAVGACPDESTFTTIGSQTITAANTTLANVRITGPVNVQAQGFTLRCAIVDIGGYAYGVNLTPVSGGPSTAGWTLEYVTFANSSYAATRDQSKMANRPVYTNSSGTARYLKTLDGYFTGYYSVNASNQLWEYVFTDKIVRTPGSHNTGMNIRSFGSSCASIDNITVRRALMLDGTSAPLALYTDTCGMHSNITFDENIVDMAYASDTWYCMYTGVDRGNSPKTSNIRFTRNIFGQSTSSVCGKGGARTGPPPSVWSGNRFLDGTPIS